MQLGRCDKNGILGLDENIVVGCFYFFGHKRQDNSVENIQISRSLKQKYVSIWIIALIYI